MSERAETPQFRTIVIGPPLSGSTQMLHEIPNGFAFSMPAGKAKAYTFDKGRHALLCQYVGGSRDGERFELGTGQLEDILGCELRFAEDLERIGDPNMYTVEEIRRSNRGLLVVILAVAIAAASQWSGQRQGGDPFPHTGKSIPATKDKK